MMIDWYRYNPDSNWTQTDRNMVNRYGCDPKTQTQTDKMMTDRYRWGPKTQTKHKLIGIWLIDVGATPKLKLNSNRQDDDQVAQSQRITKITMQVNSIGGDMPQYGNSWGSTTRSKDNEAFERSNDSWEGGYTPVCNSRGSTTRSKSEWSLWKVWCSWRKGVCPNMATQKGQQLDWKVNETCGRLNDPREGGMPQYVTENKQRCASKLLYSEICSSIM